ncbi:MAG: hypothetical protein LC790_14525, partial [Actinobacteria bacterium]|nr:hypothetical protein [Actinomycetota bacterium]
TKGRDAPPARSRRPSSGMSLTWRERRWRRGRGRPNSALTIDGADIERLSPLGTDHTTLTGRYRVLLPAPLHDRSAYRPLNTPEGAAAA